MNTNGKPSKAFSYLELGMTPVRYLIMEKRLNFLKYILNQNPESMVKQVYDEQKIHSKKGDFVYQVIKDKYDLKILLEDDEIEDIPPQQWKKMIKTKIKEKALTDLVNENKEKSKTKHIIFKELEMSEYLKENRNTELTEIIFSLRSGTFDFKEWNPWKYENNLCVMCELKGESLEHFMECSMYGKKNVEVNWHDIYENDTEKQYTIAKEVKKRVKIRTKKEEAGLDSTLAP